MSDVAQGPGWWIASDGKWYPPEQHPSVREKEPVTAPVAAAASTRPGGASKGLTTSGPKFQNMFQAAMRESSVADSVTVRYDGADEYRYGAGGGSQAGAGSPPSGGGSKKKWRKGR